MSKKEKIAAIAIVIALLAIYFTPICGNLTTKQVTTVVFILIIALLMCFRSARTCLTEFAMIITILGGCVLWQI